MTTPQIRDALRKLLQRLARWAKWTPWRGDDLAIAFLQKLVEEEGHIEAVLASIGASSVAATPVAPPAPVPEPFRPVPAVQLPSADASHIEPYKPVPPQPPFQP